MGFRLTDNAVPFFKILRKLLQTNIRSKHHATFLQKCIDEQQTPKGLRSNVTSQIPEQDIEFTFLWERAHTRFATELTTLLCQYYNRRAVKTQKGIVDTNAALKKECSEEVLKNITEYLDRLGKDLKSTLEDRRAKKLAAVTENKEGSPESTQQENPTSLTSPNTTPA